MQTRMSSQRDWWVVAEVLSLYTPSQVTGGHLTQVTKKRGGGGARLRAAVSFPTPAHASPSSLWFSHANSMLVSHSSAVFFLAG